MSTSDRVLTSVWPHVAPMIIAALTVTIVAARAHAADANDSAEALFTQAVTALDANDYATACPRFEQSYEKSPALGTAFNLALCAEHSGKHVDALKQFRSVQAKAHDAGRKKTEADAREHADVLERALGHARVHIAPGERGQITIDGNAPTDAHDEIVEPGDHVVEVVRDGGPPFRARVTVRAGESTDVDVPPQSGENVLPPVPIAPTTASAPPWHAVGIGVAAVGLVGVSTGSVFGIGAQNDRNHAYAICGGAGTVNPCAGDLAQAKGAWSDAKTEATISTAFVVTGAVLMAGGAVVYFFAPKSARSAVQASGFSMEPGRVRLGGSF